MSDQWFMVIDAATGLSVSIGTDVAHPLPNNLAAVPISDEDAAAILCSEAAWDASTRAVVDVPAPLPESVDTVRLSVWLASHGFDAAVAIREIEGLE